MPESLWNRLRTWAAGVGEPKTQSDGTESPPDWDDERWSTVLDQWADKIAGYGMEVPALMLGEAQKPVSFVFGQGVYFLEPFLDSASHFHPALRGERVEVLGALLSDRRRLEQLLQKLESRAREKKGSRE